MNGLISGFANTGVTGPITFGGLALPSGVLSGIGSGLMNSNLGFSGIFNSQKLVAG
jgi:hypothetical protein